MLQVISNLPVVQKESSVPVKVLAANLGLKKGVVVGLMQKFNLNPAQVESVVALTKEFDSLRHVVAGVMAVHQSEETVQKILAINRKIAMPIKDVSFLVESFAVDELDPMVEYIYETFVAGSDDWRSASRFMKMIMLIAKNEQMVFPDAILREAKKRWYGRADEDHEDEEE